MVKSRRRKWAGRVARVGERRSVYGVMVGKSEGKNYLKDSGVDGSIILEGSSGSGTWGYGLDRSGSG